MKRGIVMEVKRKKVVILTENGQFETVRLPNGAIPEIGDTVTFAGQNAVGTRRGIRWLPTVSTVAVVFIFILLLGGFGPTSPDSTIAAYVSYDVNPSFTAGVNGKLQVVSVKPWNQDAEQLFADWQSYQYMNLQDFTHHVVQEIAKEGYFKGKSPNVLIASTVVLQDGKKRTELNESLSHVIRLISSDSTFTSSHVTVLLKNGDPQTRTKANAKGLSLGKYLLYLDAKNEGKPLSIHSIQQMSVSEIEQFIQDDSSPVADFNQKQPTEPKPHGSNDQANDTLKNDHRAKQDHSKISMAIDQESNNNKSNQTHEASSKEQNVGSQKHESSSQSTPVNKEKLTKQNDHAEKHARKHTKKRTSEPHKAKQSHHHRNENGIHKNNRKYNEKKTAPENSSPQHQNSDSKNDDNHMNNHSRKQQRVKMTSYIHDKILGSHPVWLPILNDFDRKTESQR